MRRLSILLLILLPALACRQTKTQQVSGNPPLVIPDTNAIPKDTYGDAVQYGRELMLRTAYYIGPNGINGKFTGNGMNCTHCHQDAGTKPFSLSLMRTHQRYPSYRPREDRVLSMEERINNCVMRPHSGRPLPPDSREMIGLLSYLRWINSYAIPFDTILGEQAIALKYPSREADPIRGEILYKQHCLRCHGENGEGKFFSDSIAFQYPPLWGPESYQPGSSMHRVILQARWLKANMPFDMAKHDKPSLTDEEAIDIAAFVNDDRIHNRPNPKTFDYPNVKTKPIDYGRGPYADTFPDLQHKFGPYEPIVKYWDQNGMKIYGK